MRFKNNFGLSGLVGYYLTPSVLPYLKITYKHFAYDSLRDGKNLNLDGLGAGAGIKFSLLHHFFVGGDVNYAKSEQRNSCWRDNCRDDDG